MSTTTPASGPKKDVIYVDIEDDITSIIDKVKHADASIVALVPPKRIGVLQSVVNLKLLQRAAEGVHKRVVMITSDASLTALAAGAMIPVARNLQSKPEIPEQSSLEKDDEEVITGEEVSQNDDTNLDDTPLVVAPITASAAASKAKARRRGGPTVPNFDNFRNKTALIAGGVLALVLFFVWAFVFAPKAVVTIAAKTTPYSVNKAITATPNGALSAESGTLGAVSKELAKTTSVDFQATGKKDVGEKATGKIDISINWNSNRSGASIPAGTIVSSVSGLKFSTNETVTFTLNDFVASRDTKSTNATATANGTSFNGANGSVSGLPSGTSGQFSSPTSGGTDKTITVVSEQDAATAREKLTAQNADAVKTELKKQFSNDIMVVDESFVAAPGNPTVAPAVGQEASTAKLSVETKYSMLGLKRTDVAAIIEQDLKKQLSGIPNQQIYDKGTDSVRFTNVSKEGDAFKLSLQTTGYIGPKIDTVKLAEQLAGKREGEIIAKVKTYDGIENVAVKFSPFWVSKAPSADKVIIKFQINNDKN